MFFFLYLVWFKHLGMLPHFQKTKTPRQTSPVFGSKYPNTESIFVFLKYYTTSDDGHATMDASIRRVEEDNKDIHMK